MPCLGWRCITGSRAHELCDWIWNCFYLLSLSAILHPSSFICIILTLKGQNERRRFPAVYIQKNKEVGSQPGLSGSPGFRVDRVSPGQLLGGFLLRPGPVPGPGQPGPGSTRRAGPGFKTMVYTANLPVVRPRSCRVIYYFDTLALGIRHQSFDHVIYPLWFYFWAWIIFLSWKIPR